MNKFYKGAIAFVASSSALVATSANAAIDVTPVTTLISGDATTAATAIAVATLGLAALIYAFKRVRGAL